MSSCCIGDSEQVYLVSVPGQGSTPVQIDSAALSNRAAIAIYNDGSNRCEMMPNNPQMSYGQGFPILPGGPPLILIIKPGVKHYAICATGLTTTLRVLEIGVNP